MKHNNYEMLIGVIKDEIISELIKYLKKHNGSYEWKPKDAPIVCIENSEFFGTIYVEKIYMDEDKGIYIKGTYCDSEFEEDEFDVSEVLPCCLSMIMDALPEPKSPSKALQEENGRLKSELKKTIEENNRLKSDIANWRKRVSIMYQDDMYSCPVKYCEKENELQKYYKLKNEILRTCPLEYYELKRIIYGLD